MVIEETEQVMRYLQQLAHQRPDHYREIRVLFEFLEQHRHGAAFPEVVAPIAQSRHYPLMGEVRASKPFPPYRVLFSMDPGETRLIYLVAGNKGEGLYQGDAWYDAWVPVADAYMDEYSTQSQKRSKLWLTKGV